MTKRFRFYRFCGEDPRITWKGWVMGFPERIIAIQWYRIAMLQHFLLYFYLHLSICLPMSRWNSLQLPSLHVKGNEAAVPLVASRLKDLQDLEITEKQHGRMAIQCTHLEQRTLGERRPLGSRRTSPEVILARSGPGLSIATWATNQALFVCPLQVSSDAANWSAFNLHRTWRSFFLLW